MVRSMTRHYLHSSSMARAIARFQAPGSRLPWGGIGTGTEKLARSPGSTKKRPASSSLAGRLGLFSCLRRDYSRGRMAPVRPL